MPSKARRRAHRLGLAADGHRELHVIESRSTYKSVAAAVVAGRRKNRPELAIQRSWRGGDVSR
jgi:hypothetical protein